MKTQQLLKYKEKWKTIDDKNFEEKTNFKQKKTEQ